MISIRNHIERAERESRLLAELEANYADALLAIESCYLPLTEGFADHHRSQIRKLRDTFQVEPDVATVIALRHKLAESTKAYIGQGTEILGGWKKELRRVLQVFADAVSSLAIRGTTDSGRLTQFSRNLEAIIEIDDLPEIRKRLSREISELKQSVEEMQRRDHRTVEQLQASLEAFKERLAETERIAHTDPLTQLGNRRHGERAMECLIAAETPFSIMLIDLNGFKGINDRWGHPAGDALLVKFAGRLKNAVRATDTVCRWGGDEFLVLLPDCTVIQAAERAEKIASVCNADYEFEVHQETIRIRLSSVHGVASHRLHETIETLVGRADEILYGAKEGPRTPIAHQSV